MGAHKLNQSGARQGVANAFIRHVHQHEAVQAVRIVLQEAVGATLVVAVVVIVVVVHRHEAVASVCSVKLNRKFRSS